jgi:hypothetical protein
MKTALSNIYKNSYIVSLVLCGLCMVANIFIHYRILFELVGLFLIIAGYCKSGMLEESNASLRTKIGKLLDDLRASESEESLGLFEKLVKSLRDNGQEVVARIYPEDNRRSYWVHEVISENYAVLEAGPDPHSEDPDYKSTKKVYNIKGIERFNLDLNPKWVMYEKNGQGGRFY